MKFTSYALIGSGKVARHIRQYLTYLQLPFSTWSRAGGTELSDALAGASHVLLAVSDPAIGEVAARIPAGHVLVHFSGGARVGGVAAAHPLMTFGSDLQAEAWYRAIPFVVDNDVDFKALLPGFPNESFELAPEKRALYHALCALAGNSTFLLWQKIAAEFRALDLPPEILERFLHQTVANALKPGTLATGPVARADWAAVKAHLDSLSENPSLAAAYRDFLNQAAFNGQKIPEALL
jgi:predicted short-subunit dehydrogenase-like oxidoreductase (DUF2520 family)